MQTISSSGLSISVSTRPRMQSAISVSWSTGFREDSETSSMMDQYGPALESVDAGLLPSPWSRVGSSVESGGLLLGE